jgi:hypothetical protein
MESVGGGCDAKEIICDESESEARNEVQEVLIRWTLSCQTPLKAFNDDRKEFIQYIPS